MLNQLTLQKLADLSLKVFLYVRMPSFRTEYINSIGMDCLFQSKLASTSYYWLEYKYWTLGFNIIGDKGFRFWVLSLIPFFIFHYFLRVIFFNPSFCPTLSLMLYWFFSSNFWYSGSIKIVILCTLSLLSASLNFLKQ